MGVPLGRGCKVTLILLALIGIIESVVWLYRCRTANATNEIHSALAALGVTTTRLAFVWVGASAVLAATPWWLALGAYCGPATAGTWLAHRWMEARR